MFLVTCSFMLSTQIFDSVADFLLCSSNHIAVKNKTQNSTQVPVVISVILPT